MNWKIILFFIAILSVLMYIMMFFENRHVKTHIHIFGQKIDINVGLLILVTFLDGAIITGLLVWLL